MPHKIDIASYKEYKIRFRTIEFPFSEEAVRADVIYEIKAIRNSLGPALTLIISNYIKDTNNTFFNLKKI